jgi:hypothetical protein
VKLLLMVTLEAEDDPRYVADEVQAHLEGLGFQHVDVEIRTTHSVDNSDEEHRL